MSEPQGKVFAIFRRTASAAWKYIRANHRWLAILAWCLTITTSLLKDNILDGWRSSKENLEQAKVQFVLNEEQLVALEDLDERANMLFIAIHNSTNPLFPVTNVSALIQRKLDANEERRETLYTKATVVDGRASTLITFLNSMNAPSTEVAEVTKSYILLDAMRPILSRKNLGASNDNEFEASLTARAQDIATQQDRLTDLTGQALAEAQKQLEDRNRSLNRWMPISRYLIASGWLLTLVSLFLSEKPKVSAS